MIRIVKMTFKEEFVQPFETLFEERKLLIRQFEGCEQLQLWQDQSNRNSFYTYSVWRHEDDLELYRCSKLFRDTWATVKKWFSEKPLAFSVDKLIDLP